jgi:hypothetical protein
MQPLLVALLRGSQITLVPLAANLWSVNGVLVGSGTAVTPFS